MNDKPNKLPNLSNLPTLPNIPIFGIPDVPLEEFSQRAVPIADIVNDIVIFKDGGACLVLESTSLNFGLLSEKEQEAVIAAFAALLNSFSFSVQIVVRSQLKDISNYLKYLEVARAKIDNPKLGAIMEGYKNFIAETIKRKNVLSKKFYLVIPFSPLELGITKSFMSITKKAQGPLPYTKADVFKKAKNTLIPKRDHLIRQAGRLGLKLKQLTTLQLVDLYYDVFNPTAPTIKKQEVEDAR